MMSKLHLEKFSRYDYKVFLLCIILSLVATGCQLPLANYLRDQVFPEDTATKVALSPVLLPAYATASVVDVAMINPTRGMSNVPEVVKNIWEWEDQHLWLGKGVLLPLKFIGIPLATIGTVIFSEQFIYEKTDSVPATESSVDFKTR